MIDFVTVRFAEMFSTVLIPRSVWKIAVILLLAIATVMLPMSPVLAEAEIAPIEEIEISPTVISEVESLPETDAELETVDGMLEEEIFPEESQVEPMVQLTPEQNLILALQAKITELAGSYSDERVQSIKMNLSRHLLQVEVKPDWYQLDPQQQDEMAQKLLTQAQKLAFKRLEMVNPQGQLIARNPVIGKKMIILDRYPD
jgi:hypothetical protein